MPCGKNLEMACRSWRDFAGEIWRDLVTDWKEIYKHLRLKRMFIPSEHPK
jgi:hypothetical protein